MEINIKDQDQRLQALDNRKSFIVQAPAGSGKTELLTQRFLVLLATVRHAPEEIIAITFTRKAAAEMKSRIFDALHFAAAYPAPTQSHTLQTWNLAKKVLERDKQEQWNLLSNPNRLRVTTIDSLCGRIAKSAPLESNFGSIPEIVEDAHSLYQEAAQRLLTSLNESHSWVPFLEKLLLHLDNNYALIEKLFIAMLSRRDQWLNYIMDQRCTEQPRQYLEHGLKNIILDTLNKAQNLFPPKEQAEICALASFAASALNMQLSSSLITNCADLRLFPKNELKNLAVWRGIAELLLTKSFEWRKAVNKNCGFPAAGDASDEEQEFLFKNMKQRMTQLLIRLSEDEQLRTVLKEILLLPPPTYPENQWDIVEALVELLPILVASLNVIFQERNVTDFIAVTEGAIHALGGSEEPSDIALNLDYHLQHLLVDEFQDISNTQYRLLQLLTAGWESNDGRTLFLVGDPMQSIYRFREAEVGIFLKVKKFGLGTIKLSALKLEVNFRSQTELIDWFNNSFENIFPSHENEELGAIPYSASMGFRDKNEAAGVFAHPLFSADDEGKEIIQLLLQELSDERNNSIAILVRSRSHLHQIIPQLKNAGILFHAVEVEKLLHSPAVQDLLALTRALSHTADRIAWLAILRAPWCGLDLTDLYLIANYQADTIYETLRLYQNIPGLSEAALIRLQRIVPVLIQAIVQRSRHTVRGWIAETWYALGGPACIEEEHELQNVDYYFQILSNCCHETIDFKKIEHKLLNSYCHLAPPEARVHLMTIHKSKGLEFDVVIIPGLERRPAMDDNRLLLWLERQCFQHETNLILAPIHSQEETFDPIYRYVKNQENIKAGFEVTRLLYVAMTRAKCKLHLFGNGVNDPPAGSFLYLLWPHINDKFVTQETTSTVALCDEKEKVPLLKRLALEWQSDRDVLPIEQEALVLAKNTFSWNLHYLPQTGTVIHEILQWISINGVANLSWIMNKMRLQKKLLQLGVLQKELGACLDMVEKAISQTIMDERGKWILNTEHQEACCEFPITFYSNGVSNHYFIDRTFVENNIRWIIDYKVSESINEEEVSLENTKKRYAQQLENYADAMSLLDNRPIKVAIYFPLTSGWFEWEYRGIDA